MHASIAGWRPRARALPRPVEAPHAARLDGQGGPRRDASNSTSTSPARRQGARGRAEDVDGRTCSRRWRRGRRDNFVGRRRRRCLLMGRRPSMLTTRCPDCYRFPLRPMKKYGEVARARSARATQGPGAMLRLRTNNAGGAAAPWPPPGLMRPAAGARWQYRREKEQERQERHRQNETPRRPPSCSRCS